MTEQSGFPDYEMEEYFEATEPEHHKAFADPTRQRVVNLLYERAATTKQLAGALGQSPGRMAHHLKVLEGVGLVRVVRTRQVRAITEKYYGNTYRRVNFTARGFSWRENLPELEPFFLLRQAIDEYDRSALEVERRPGAVAPMSLVEHARVPASRADEFAAKVLELAKEFESDPVPGERVWGFVAAVYPTDLPELPEDADA
ncbi:helix-turn-helix domain-containing protein [Rubrobacter tropicus]|uniref:Helix-turn-helix domain-containing protein n=1 Tax=Rubrobacter tropicus TaxID=2653851 RepID=A0A6G8Q843_9ACTN|nr:winged helix-turn-helix domain-containing protein [Rubrobacter tropicus]QIN82640.1 helix-turn-helix domain-containing protein [Rubrobacter tropicus]